ncbi:MAG: glycosyltransferase family 2 protein [Caldilineales bacterium]|nr:glycosyltransferase family 2 protein [Caldilineales bacterium]MDW8316464.1 glycosyltransferase family 2 protein [Anaerolineae bacterium]
MSRLDLAVIILNYNTRDLLRRCLQTVFASQGDLRFSVCVVDNASGDGSADMVRQEFPQAVLIASPVNGGFSYGNNLGLRHYGFTDRPGAGDPTATPRYALLLNPDTEVPPTALADMVAFMDATPACGVAGPKLVRLDGSLDLACRRSFPTPEVSLYRMLGLSKLFPRSRRFGRYNLTYLDPDQMAEVDSVVGAFMMVRGEAIHQVGLLDETFFMYGEDLDWAYRIKQQGWQVWYQPAVTVLHVKEAASKTSSKARYEFYRAMLIFYRKHYQATTPRWLHWLIVGGIGLRGGIDVAGRRLSLLMHGGSKA